MMNSETINEKITLIKALAQLPSGGSIPDIILQLNRLHDAVERLQQLIATAQQVSPTV